MVVDAQLYHVRAHVTVSVRSLGPYYPLYDHWAEPVIQPHYVANQMVPSPLSEPNQDDNFLRTLL